MNNQNALLAQIADQAAEDLKDLIKSGNDDILAAIHKMQTEAQLQEAKPKFSLGYKIVLDYDAGTYDCDLSWTLKQSLSVSHQIDDPFQGKLPMDDDKDTVTFSAPGSDPVTMGLKQFNRAVNKISDGKMEVIVDGNKKVRMTKEELMTDITGKFKK